MVRNLISVAVVALTTAISVFAQPTEEQRVESLLQQMTLQEKIGQLNQLSVGGFDQNTAGMMRAGMVGSILNECNPKVLNRYQKAAVEESRLGIPLIISRDVIHGFKTIFPIPLGLAATFDPELVQQGARVAAIEATASGIRWTFSPMLDIARDPRWGRIAEGSGTTIVEVNRLLKQFEDTRKVMKMMAGGGIKGKAMNAMKAMKGMRR